MPEPTKSRSLNWTPLIMACGAFGLGLSTWNLGILALNLRAKSSQNPMVWMFGIIFFWLLLVSCRLVLRRLWAGIAAALLGWFLIYDLATSPVAKNKFDVWTLAVVLATLVLTVALFAAPSAWKRRF